MRVKIVAFGYFSTDVHFKIEGGTEGKELKVGDVVGYIDPDGPYIPTWAAKTKPSSGTTPTAR